MKVTAVLLADAATVREGLLHVLGGGINRLVRDPLPGRLDVVLALMLQPDNADDLLADHNLEVIITEMTPEGPFVVAKAIMELPVYSSSGIAGPKPSLPLVVPLQSVPVPRASIYQITTNLDGQEANVYEFEVAKAPEQSQPPEA